MFHKYTYIKIVTENFLYTLNFFVIIVKKSLSQSLLIFKKKTKHNL